MGFYASKYGFEAFPRKPAGAPVIAAAVVTIDEQTAVRQGMCDVMAKEMILELEIVGPEQGLMRDGAKGDNHFQVRHGGKLGLQMGVALANFGSHRFIGGR